MTAPQMKPPRVTTAENLAQMIERMIQIEEKIDWLMTQPVDLTEPSPAMTPEQMAALCDRLIREVILGVDARLMLRCGPMIATMGEYYRTQTAAITTSIARYEEKLTAAANRTAAALDGIESTIRQVERQGREAVNSVTTTALADMEAVEMRGRTALDSVTTTALTNLAAAEAASRTEIERLAVGALLLMRRLTDATASLSTEAKARAADAAGILSDAKAAKVAAEAIADRLGPITASLELALDQMEYLGPALGNNAEARVRQIATHTGLVSSAATSASMIAVVWALHALGVRL